MTDNILPAGEAIPCSERPHPKYPPVPFVCIALLLIFILYQGLGGAATYFLYGVQITREAIAGIRTMTMVSQFVFLLVPALLLTMRQHGALSVAIPMRVPKPAEVILVVVCVVSMQQVLEGYLFFQDMLPLPVALREIVEAVKRAVEDAVKLIGEAHSVSELLFVLLVVAVTPAICEEIFFRGLLQKNISLASTPLKGVVITGAIFAVYHLNPFLLVPLTVLGILFSYMRYRSMSLIIPMIAHFTNNALSTVGYFWQQNASGTFMLDGGEADVSQAYVLGIMAFASLIFALSFTAYQIVTSSIHTEQADRV